MNRDQQRRRGLGRLGEAAAVEELELRGYAVLARNYRCRGGEADIVAEQGETLVFVEVKARATLQYGRPAEAVGWSKQQKLEQAALHYCQQHDIEDRPLRFDIVEVVFVGGEVATVVHLPGAFTPGD